MHVEESLKSAVLQYLQNWMTLVIRISVKSALFVPIKETFT